MPLPFSVDRYWPAMNILFLLFFFGISWGSGQILKKNISWWSDHWQKSLFLCMPFLMKLAVCGMWSFSNFHLEWKLIISKTEILVILLLLRGCAIISGIFNYFVQLRQGSKLETSIIVTLMHIKGEQSESLFYWYNNNIGHCLLH